MLIELECLLRCCYRILILNYRQNAESKKLSHSGTEWKTTEEETLEKFDMLDPQVEIQDWKNKLEKTTRISVQNSATEIWFGRSSSETSSKRRQIVGTCDWHMLFQALSHQDMHAITTHKITSTAEFCQNVALNWAYFIRNFHTHSKDYPKSSIVCVKSLWLSKH